MIMLALVDGTPRVLNLKQILEEYIKHQKSVIVRRTQFDLDKSFGKRTYIARSRQGVDEYRRSNRYYQRSLKTDSRLSKIL